MEGKKIAVIVLDNVVKENYGDFGDMGVKLLGKFGECSKIDYFHEESLPKLETVDIVYFTGSRKDSYLNNEFNNKLVDYIKSIFEYNEQNKGQHQVKVIGICFGHQIIARALGFKVTVNPLGWELGQYVVKSEELGDYTISMVHQDIVLPDRDSCSKKNVKITGSTPKCQVQGLKIDNELLTFQGHPEFNKDYTMQIAEEKFKEGHLNQKDITEIRSRYNEIESNNVVSNTISDFLIN